MYNWCIVCKCLDYERTVRYELTISTAAVRFSIRLVKIRLIYFDFKISSTGLNVTKRNIVVNVEIV